MIDPFVGYLFVFDFDPEDNDHTHNPDDSQYPDHMYERCVDH